MANIKLVIEYDGTCYGGWQKQNNVITIQEAIETSLHQLTGENIVIHGAGRTDSGVHAVGQVANFRTQSSIPSDNFASALNTKLPLDIRIRKSALVEDSFHARFSAAGKRYKYSIFNDAQGSALWRHVAYHIRPKLNVEAMEKAARFLLGTHDFASFRAAGSNTVGSVRTIHRAEVSRHDSMIEFLIEGNGFLYNMVRIISGTLIEIGKGKIMPEDMGKIIDLKDRVWAGPTAPPHGLCLMEVLYTGVN